MVLPDGAPAGEGYQVHGSNVARQLQNDPDRSSLPGPHESDPRCAPRRRSHRQHNLIRIIQQVQPDDLQPRRSEPCGGEF